MDTKRPENEQMPDFKELEDRVIAEHTKAPILVVKTNLDPKESTEDNPYYKNKELTDTTSFKDYFEE